MPVEYVGWAPGNGADGSGALRRRGGRRRRLKALSLWSRWSGLREQIARRPVHKKQQTLRQCLQKQNAHTLNVAYNAFAIIGV
jgi:hypothetical protein